jgi:hypothetical protein
MADPDWTRAETLRLQRNLGVVLPCEPADMDRGGIVGVARLVDCVTQSDSPWFVGPYGFVLDRAQPVPFALFGGRLGFFEVPGCVFGWSDLPPGYAFEPMHMAHVR